MSQYFQVGDLQLWNPATRVAVLFVRTSEAVAAMVEAPTGIGPVIADEYEIEPATFAGLVDTVTELYLSSSHTVLRSLLEGFLATALVLVERMGLPPPVPLDLGRLRRLTAEHAAAMPR